MKRFVFFEKFCCSIHNKRWSSQSAEEIKPITVICPLEDVKIFMLKRKNHSYQFLSGIRDSRKAGSLWGMMRGVGGVRKSIHQSSLAKLLGLLCWGFKGVQEEIPSEEASTLQIESVAFPTEQCTNPQLHPCHRLFDQIGIKTVPYPPL